MFVVITKLVSILYLTILSSIVIVTTLNNKHFFRFSLRYLSNQQGVMGN